MPGTGTGPAREGSATLTLHLPADTKVFINGRETLSTGNERQYVSHGLQPGLEYKYEIRAEVTCVRKVGPQVVERLKIPLTRTVFLTAGESQHVAFTSDVVTIPNEITGEDQVLVIDDELKRIQGQLAASKRTKSGPRPPSWGP